ncbi:MAG TPA: hypothetical protein VEL74_00495 [Thermoanaerobaculia bacterium]|nr:hypothetical protein [Thermoanaerobaculia bacterium]
MKTHGGMGGGLEDGARLVFNGVLNRGDGSGYLLAPRTPQELLAEIGGGEPPSPPTVPRPLPSYIDANDLAKAGWGVIWAPGLDPRVKEALEPLLALRQREAGPLYREVEARPGETFFQLLKRLGASVAPVDPKRLPYYLLVVGEPAEVPFELQYQLDVAHAVGRLCFATPEEYGRYALGVVAVEENGVRRPRRLGIFAVQNQDDWATLSCREHLATPLAESLRREVQDWEVDSCLGSEATKARLRQHLGGEATPAMLLTCSHGLMYQVGDPLQPTDQGGLICADWPGPERWKERLPTEQYLAARDIADTDDLSGLISFQFACFSAGTPERDSFSRARGSAVARLAARDMMAPLAQRLLGKPGGSALAVVGHVDQVFEASYLWPGVGRQLETFEACLRGLMAGERLGLALEPFGHRHATIATFLTELLEQWRRQPETRPVGVSDALGEAFLWLAHNDARGYLLLGDPAVRPAVGRDTLF